MRDITLADTFYQLFTTRAFATGIPTVLAGSPVVSAYENEGLTQITAGITLGVDHDGVVGLNLLTVVATGANGYEAGKDYALVITTGTVSAVSVVGEVVAEFSIGRSAAAVDLANATDGLGALKAETAAIVLDTAEIGTAGAGLTNINLPNQTMDITGNITGNLSGTVGSVTGAVGSVTGAVGSVTGAVGSVTGHTAQTGDNYARLGAPAGASVSADIAAVKVDTAATLVDTGTTLPASLKGLVLVEGTLGATGNDTTHLHLVGLTYGDDEINNYNLVLYDNSASEYHSMTITDWVLSTALAVVPLLPFTPEASVDTYWLTHSIAGTGTPPTAIAIRQEMDSNSTQLAAIVADTNELQVDWVNGGRLDLLIDAIPTTAMRGTDNAALASVATEARLAELDPANLPADVAAVNSTVTGIGGSSGGAVNIQATSDNTGGAIIDAVTFVGSVQSGTYASTESEDGVLHDIDDTADDIDIVYGFSVGGGRSATELSFAGFVQGSADEMKIKVYDHVGSDWEIIGTVGGTNSTTNTVLSLPLLLKHTGTGAELGNVYIRFDTDSTTPSNLSIDQIVVSAVNVGTTVGYANGQVWIDTVSGVAGTENFVNGVADNPVDTIASALTIAASVNLRKFWVGNGSTITLAASLANKVMEGHEWTLALGGQNIASSMFIDASVSGTATGAEAEFKECVFATASLEASQFYDCSFTGTVTFSAAGQYRFINCQSGVAGASAPTFALGTGDMNVEFRRWSGGMNLTGIGTNDVLTISGELGTIDLGSATAGTVEIRGTYKALTNASSGVTVNTDGAIKGVDVATTLADTNELQTDWANGGRLDLLIDAIKVATDLLNAADAEPTGVPAANETPLVKLAYLFMEMRNKVTVTATKKTVFGDDDAAEYEYDVSDDATTYTESEANVL